MNVYAAMNTAKWALLTHQTAIEVTGQNIANVNNPDYNKQEVRLESAFPVNFGRMALGTGVQIEGVERRFDKFLFSQRLESNFNLARWEARNIIMSRLDVVLNEADGNGINQMMSQMFQSFYNLSINASGLTERQDVVEKARLLARNFSAAANELKGIRRDIDQKITASIPEINRITTEIAQINKTIHETEVGNVTANDFRDQREALIMDLSKLVDVSYFEQSNNEVVVMMNNGRPLVVGQSAFNLSTRVNPQDPETSSIFWTDASGTQTDITTEFNSGNIGAWIELRETDLPNILDDLDRLAASIIKDVNNLHASGLGLDGTAGTDFFTNLTPGGTGDATNSGSGVLGTGTLLDPETVGLDHYRITFDGAGNYSVFNKFTNAASGTFSYTSGAALTFFQQIGYSISVTGAPAAGDTFDISASHDAAVNMTVNPNVVNNLNRIAAGSTTQLGDGTLARRIADLQYTRLIGTVPGAATASGLFTFDDFFSSIVGQVGSGAVAAKNGLTQQESISTQLLNLREQASGVSLDEEMVNLVKFQHAYSAAAKMISTVDELLVTLLNIK
ncbi:MAG: flagellar hook-associated protein FlgK [Nitrospinota bacterium]